MKNIKELEIEACKTFVCPNIGLIEQKGKELSLDDKTIEMAKDLAIRYLKKTYHAPHYSHIKYLLPSFIYISSIYNGNRRMQDRLSEVFGVSNVTIRKWNEDIIDTLELDIIL